MTASVSLSLFQEKCIHTVAWYEPDKMAVYRKKISKELHIYELINRMSFMQSFDDAEILNAYFEDAFRGENYSTIIDICKDGEIYVNQLPVEIPRKKQNIEWNKIALTV